MGQNTVASNDANWQDYKPKQDLNPFYRTMDILNGVFKKKVRFEKGPRNCTDLNTIWVNLNEVRLRPIARVEQPKDGKYFYTLQCGHPWESKNSYAVDKYIPCWTCGTNQAYLGFEHEWEHIIFKSNLMAQSIFVEQYTADLLTQTPGLSSERVKAFLSIFINIFDDVRVNSLQEKVYPGSAASLWERWKRLVSERDYNSTFTDFTMAIGLGMPVDPKSQFYSLAPIIEWGMTKARYRGFGRMLLDVRIVLDRCMGALLAQQRPPHENSQHTGSLSQGKAGYKDDENNPQTDGGKPQHNDQEGDQKADEDGGVEEHSEENGGGSSSQLSDADPSPTPPITPSSAQAQATSEERQQALASLVDGAEPIDNEEVHHTPTQEERDKDPASLTNRLMIRQLLDQDIEDLTSIDQSQTNDVPDTDMQHAIDLLRNAIPEKSQDSKLMEDARAKILFIDVEPYHIDETSYINLTEPETDAVERLRGIFFKELGRKKAFRDITGPAVDIPAFIQFRIDRRDPDVFEGEALNRGFSYHVLSDMSGSMSERFPLVAHSMIMLKHSLDFPFVQGEFWGFRGGDGTRVTPAGKIESNGEVWLYRYNKNCKGYLGKATARANYTKHIPVCCGGLTPMHAALRVSIKHISRNVPTGMAKQIFLLTDGSPFHIKAGGKLLNDGMLRSFVTKEVKWARTHGIEVYTIVIGNGITDEQALMMFGNRKFWQRASGGKDGEDTVDKVLTSLVMANFSKYLRTR
jgi:hypothetical protein